MLNHPVLRHWLIVGAPIAALVVCGLLAALAFALDISRVHDRAAAAREQRLLALTLEREQANAAALAEEYAAWDDAYRNIVVSFSPQWAHTNYFTSAYDQLAVLDDHGALVYQRDGAATASIARVLGSRAPALIALSRQAFARGQAAIGSFETTPEGALMHVTVSPIRPISLRPSAHAPARYVVLASYYTPARIAALAASVDLSAIVFRPLLQTPAHTDDLAYPLRGADNAAVGDLVWPRPHPGAAALAARAPVLALLFLLLGAGAALITRALVSARLRHLERARKAAELASHAKSQFLAHMSHEFRTPLHAIMGYAELQIEEAEARADDSARHDLGRLHAASQHLLSIINDVLDLSKIEAGALHPTPAACTLGAIVDQVIATARPLCMPNNNVLRVDNRVGEAALHTDKRFVRQILINLLGNAAKFTTNGLITLCIERTGPHLAFHVIDTGIGMSETQLAALFQPFVQADAPTMRRYGGTGLGLALSRKLARMLGGDIVVTSQEGEGSTFTLLLRAEPAAQAAAA